MTAAELIHYLQNVQQHNNLNLQHQPISVQFVDEKTGTYKVIEPDTLAYTPETGFILKKVNNSFI